MYRKLRVQLPTVKYVSLNCVPMVNRGVSGEPIPPHDIVLVMNISD